MEFDSSRIFHGFVNVDKPPGMTSRDVVDRVLHAFPGPRKRRPKAGHAGTLDPLATGVLVIALGPATRLIEVVQAGAKTYRAEVLLGAVSDTLDADGTVTPVAGAIAPDEEAVKTAARSFVGVIQQLPPEYSALRVGGKRAYELARDGKEVQLAPRPVRVDRVEVLRYEYPRLSLEIDCGAGTYIRSIARDLGEALGVGGLIAELRRTRVGPFRAEDAAPLDRLSGPDAIAEALRPPASAVADWARVPLSEDDVKRIRDGMPIPVPPELAGDVALIGPGGELVALAEALNGRAQPRRVLAAP